MPTPPAARAIVVTGPPGAVDAALAATLEAVLAPLAPNARRWLSHGEALEFIVEKAGEGSTRELAARLAAALGPHPVDVNVVPAGPGRRKRLLVADMDSTIIEQECIDEMAAAFGLGTRIAAITERAMRGELDFEAALEQRVGLLAGLSEATLADIATERITLTPGARVLVATMRGGGAETALVSGGFTFFTERIGRRAGFARNEANRLEIVDGRLTGRVLPPILGRAAKRSALARFAVQHRIGLEETLAVGDGANDRDMVEAAGLGVAFRAKPVLQRVAAASITHGDLTALLYLQGFCREEFVASSGVPATDVWP